MNDGSIYTLNTNRYGTHKIIASLIGKEQEVLDVGCSGGYLGTLVPKNLFFGIDVDVKSLEKAKENGYVVKLVDLDTVDDNFSLDRKFDIIVFADVLEHLKLPERVGGILIRKCLKEGGTVIISLPNVAHISVRTGLVFGKFDYRECGILDRTHLHLYTVKSASELARKLNLTIVRVLFSSNNLGGIIRKIPALGPVLGYNIIMLCKKC